MKSEYINSWRHSWDWSYKFPWPEWWKETLPALFSRNKSGWIRHYINAGNKQTNDLIQMMFRIYFWVKNRFTK